MKNTQVIHVIDKKGSVAAIPDGSVPLGSYACNGALLSKADHHELYSVIGDTFSPSPTIFVSRKKSWWQRLLRIDAGGYSAQNPDYDEGKFGLPDLRNSFNPKTPW